MESTPIGTPSQASQADLFSLLEAVLDHSEFQERKMIANFMAEKLGHHAREENDGGETSQRNYGWHRRTIGSMSSAFRGVIKCYERRFEAFAWDYSVEKGGIVYIGAYVNEIDAARAHDMVSLKIGCLERLLNFPGRSYLREAEYARTLNKKEFVENIRVSGDDNTIDCPFRGVYRNLENGKWEARLGRRGLPTVILGAYNLADNAARAYDIISIKLKGWEAITNFDIACYNVKRIVDSVITQKEDGTIILRPAEKNEANPQRSSPVQDNRQQLSDSSLSHGNQNPNLIPSSPRTQAYAQSSLIGQRSPQQLRNSSLVRGLSNPNTISGDLGIQAYRQSSLGQSISQLLNNSSSSHGFQNPNLIPSNLGIQAYPGTNFTWQHNSQQLTTSSFSHGFQNPSVIPINYESQAYPQGSSLGEHNTLGGFTIGIGNSGNSIANLEGVFPNQNATLQHSLLIQDQVNANNFYSHYLLNNNNHFLPESSNPPLRGNFIQNFEIDNSDRLPNFALDFGKFLLGGDKEFGSPSTPAAMYEQLAALTTGEVNKSTEATGGASSSGPYVQQVPPPNQQIGAAQPQLPELNQSYEPGNFQANTYLQNLDENLNSFFEGFQNPGSSSQPNNTGPQNHASGIGNDLIMIDSLNRSFMEDNVFDSDFDFFQP